MYCEPMLVAHNNEPFQRFRFFLLLYKDYFLAQHYDVQLFDPTTATFPSTISVDGKSYHLCSSSNSPNLYFFNSISLLFDWLQITHYFCYQHFSIFSFFYRKISFPFSVKTYFWFCDLGLSGIVMVISSISSSCCKYFLLNCL